MGTETSAAKDVDAGDDAAEGSRIAETELSRRTANLATARAEAMQRRHMRQWPRDRDMEHIV